MHHETTRTLHALWHVLRGYLLLACILGGVFFGMLIPGPGRILARIDLSFYLVVGIFLIQGMKMDTSSITGVRRFLPVLGCGALVALVLYPLSAFAIARLLGLNTDFTVGMMLIASMPTTLAAAIPMTLSAGGDPLMAVVLVVFLNLFGLVTIPANLAVWLGSSTTVSPLSVLTTLVFYLFLPMGVGQAMRRFRPGLTQAIARRTHDLPDIFLGLLVYTTCARESALFAEVRLSELALLILPCLGTHLSMLASAWIVSTKWLKLGREKARAFFLICSEKPVTLSLALWTLHFGKVHHLAVFPIIVFYILQMVTDSVVVSTLGKTTGEGTRPVAGA